MSYQGPQQFEPEAPRPSAWRSLIRVISEPAATFQAFEGRVPIFPPYLIGMVLGLAGSLMTLPSVLRTLEQTYAAMPNFTPQMVAVGRYSAIGTAVAGALIAPWLGGLLVSLFALFFGQFQEERVSFNNYLGMVGYARIPLALSSFLTGALMLALGNRVKELNLSLAAFAPASTGMVVKFLLGLGSPFGIWYYILLAIGFGALHRAKAAKGAGLVLTVFVLLALLGAGMSALGSGLMRQI